MSSDGRRSTVDDAGTRSSTPPPGRLGRTALLGLVAFLAAGVAGCGKVTDAELLEFFEVVGRIDLGGSGLGGATVFMSGGGSTYSGVSDVDGRFRVEIARDLDYQVHTNATAFCPQGMMFFGAGTPYELDVPCFLPGGAVEATFTLGANNCGFPPGEFGATLQVHSQIIDGSIDGRVGMDFVASDDFTISGEYDPLTREYSGSSEEVTDQNGITSSETWTATVAYEFGSPSAAMTLTSTATFVDESTGGQCQAEATGEILFSVP